MAMMCSERELELSDEHNGIIDLPKDAPVRTRLCPPMRILDDPVIEINLTPTGRMRPSVYGHRQGSGGRAGSAGRGGAIMLMAAIYVPGKVTIEAPELLPGLALRLVRREERAVAEWLQQKADRHWPQANQRAGRPSPL